MTELTCRALIAFLDDYVEDRLDTDRRNRFEKHLAVCRHCREYLLEYRLSIALACALHMDPEASISNAPRELIAAVIEAVAS